jgi:hypothetical protein
MSKSTINFIYDFKVQVPFIFRKKLYEKKIHEKIVFKSNDAEIGTLLESIPEKSSMEGNHSRFTANFKVRYHNIISYLFSSFSTFHLRIIR